MCIRHSVQMVPPSAAAGKKSEERGANSGKVLIQRQRLCVTRQGEVCWQAGPASRGKRILVSLPPPPVGNSHMRPVPAQVRTCLCFYPSRWCRKLCPQGGKTWSSDVQKSTFSEVPTVRFNSPFQSIFTSFPFFMGRVVNPTKSNSVQASAPPLQTKSPSMVDIKQKLT